MRSEPPLGHADAVRGLWRAARAGRLPHALLVTGPSGIGKFLAVEWLARGMLCAHGPGDPCDACGPCKRALAGTHPDLFVIDPVAEREEQIKVERIAPREEGERDNVLDFLSLCPMEGGWRVVLVRDAERMNPAAQNALLKTLEEPGRATLLVLVAAEPERLLPTVASRCARIALAPLPLPLAQAALERAAGGAAAIEPERAARLARWSGGAPGRARELVARGGEELVALVLDVLAGRTDALAAGARIGELEGDFGTGTARQQARERARTLIDLAIALLCDLSRARAGLAAEGLAFGDVGHELAPPGAAELERLLEAGLGARQDVERNLAPEAVLELLLLELEGACAGGASSR